MDERRRQRSSIGGADVSVSVWHDHDWRRATACRLLNGDGTTDEPPLSANWTGHFLGNFTTGPGMSATTNYAIESGPFLLPAMKSSQEYEFYLKNACGVTITAGWTLKITPVADGPKA